ncbi:MAG: hypothetical protein FK733_13155 [Asgard group archaeon]|nr:hypothetical protein [Asgard group archaeon]
MISNYPSLISYDEFRTNIQDIQTTTDNIIKDLKDKGDPAARSVLSYYQGLFSLINAEKHYRAGSYNEALTDFTDAEKKIEEFQKMGTGLTVEYQQKAERLDLFTKGRQSECKALIKGAAIDDQIANLIEAVNSYTLEIEIVSKLKKPVLTYNAEARKNFLQGLIYRLEGLQAENQKDFRLAKKKHLDSYGFFTKAAYYNPTYTVWIKEQDNTIKKTMFDIVKAKAEKEWSRAFKLSNNGSFLESSEKCRASSKLYLRASTLALEQRDKLLMESHSHMLKASMFEAKANEFIKIKNDAKSAVPQYELAAEEMTHGLDIFPKREDDKQMIKRWEAQLFYYKGHYFQTQGIIKLDAEEFKEALDLFNQAEEQFVKALEEAEISSDPDTFELVEKAHAEAKGYIGMCKTVLD